MCSIIQDGNAVVGREGGGGQIPKLPTCFGLTIRHHLTRTLSDDPQLTTCPFLSLFSASQMYEKGSQLDDLMSLKHRNPSSQASTGQSGGLRQSQMIF